MKKLLLITIIICTALVGKAQTTKPIDGFLGIKFGSTAAQVIDGLTAKGAVYRKDKSSETTLIFTNVTLGTHKSSTFFVYLIDNQIYQSQFVFRPELEAKSIENYNTIVTDVNDVYGQGKSQKSFQQPYQEGDGYEVTAITAGKATYETLWTDSNTKNTIYAAIDNKGYTRLTYQDSNLMDKAINQQKEKNKSDF